jgi:hypothetical protein
MNQKNRIFKISFFILLVILSDKFIGQGLKHLYFLQKVGTAGQLNYSMLDTKEGFLILGNSRAQHHYNNKIITDSTGISCYNAGVDGGYGIWLSYAVTDAILKRYTPKLIVVEFNPASMGYSKTNYEKLSVLLPYKDNYAVCKKLVAKRSNTETYKWVSGIYPFNSMVYSLLTNKLFESKLKHVTGFIPIQNKEIDITKDTTALFNNIKDTTDVLNFESLASLLQLCKNKKIELLFINSPVFSGKSERLINQTKAAQLALQMITEAGFQYWDFTDDKRLVTDARLFADQLHLNAAGADFYTSIFAEKLRYAMQMNIVH